MTGQQATPPHTHSWRLTLAGAHGVMIQCDACGLGYGVDEAHAVDLILNGQAYKAVAEAAYRYLVDMASMDAAGRAAAFDALYAAVMALPEEMRRAL